MSSVPLTSPPHHTPVRVRATTQADRTLPPPMFGSNFHPLSAPYLPFFVGVEFEILVRPRPVITEKFPLPDIDASVRKRQDYNLQIRAIVAEALSAHGMPCNIFDDEEQPDYTKWNAMLDGSISKKHQKDGFFPIEIVSPLVTADDTWVQVVDHFFRVLLQHFELRRDTSCGFHIHTSTASGRFDLGQLRKMAKAVVFWGPATAKCAPPTRQDRMVDFCRSNCDSTDLGTSLLSRGRIHGLRESFEYIDSSDVDAIIHFICPDKYRAWNFRPSRSGGPGSIEFRRPPGVVTAKKAKHWIAFTLSFLELAIQFDLSTLPGSVVGHSDLESIYCPAFEEKLQEHARCLGVYAQLDPRLRQLDEPRTLHITMMQPQKLAWLNELDSDYRLSQNA